MENTILEKAVEPKNTVQFLPKDLFKVISKKYHAFHGWYHACISGYPCGVKVQPITLRGQNFAIGLHKDTYLCQFFLFAETHPFISGDKKIIDNKKIVMVIHGGKISSGGLGSLYNNKLYYDMHTVAYHDPIGKKEFDPAFAISAIMGEMGLINLSNPLPTEVKIDVGFLREVQPYRLPECVKEKKEGIFY